MSICRADSNPSTLVPRWGEALESQLLEGEIGERKGKIVNAIGYTKLANV